MWLRETLRAAFQKHRMLLLLFYRGIVVEVFLYLSCSPGLDRDKDSKNKEPALLSTSWYIEYAR